jgi:hypothetical protein
MYIFMKDSFFVVVAKPSRIIHHMNSADETWQMWLFSFMPGAEEHNKLCCWLHWLPVQK